MKELKESLKTLKDLEVDESGKGDNYADSQELRQEAINYVQHQKVNSDGNIKLYFHCKNCLNQRLPSNDLEGGFTSSQSWIRFFCKNCKKLVWEVDLSEIQNDWIKHFFGITGEDLK